MADKDKRGSAQIDVAYVANLARLSLTAEEQAVFQQQLEGIVGYVMKVAEADVSGVEPTAHGAPVQNVFRDDKPGACLPRETVLANAPSHRSGQFLVPKIVD